MSLSTEFESNKIVALRMECCVPIRFRIPRKYSMAASKYDRPFSYSTKEPGSSVIFIHFYMRGSIEWR